MKSIDAIAASNEMAATVEAARASVVQVQSGGRGIGTGVVWRSNAARSEIVTNAHVVAGAERPSSFDSRSGGSGRQLGIRIITYDGREFDATVTASNAQLDLAVADNSTTKQRGDPER